MAAELDGRSWRLLEHLAWRVTFVVGNNLPMIARSLDMTAPDVVRGVERLCGQGLACQEALSGGAYRLKLTDDGLRALESRAASRPQRRGWFLG